MNPFLERNLLPEQKELVREFESDIIGFGRYITPQMFTFPSPEVHYELESIMLNPARNHVVTIIPRDHAKSSIMGCLWPMHHIFVEDIPALGTDAPRFVVLVSKTQALSIRALETIKDILTNSASFKALFGDWGVNTARRWGTETGVILKDGTMILPLGTRQPVHGLKELHQRPTLVILDDPEDLENTKTPESMEYNMRWLLKSLEPTLAKPSGKIAVIGTPIKDGCMVEKLSALSDDPEHPSEWYCVRYSCWADKDNEIPLWSEKFSREWLLAKKAAFEAAGYPHLWYSEYECSIEYFGQEMFNPADFRWWNGSLEFDEDHLPYLIISHRGLTDGVNPAKQKVKQEHLIKLASPLLLAVNVFLGVDPASSISARADSSCIMPSACCSRKDRYVLDYYLSRLKPLALADMVMTYQKRFRPERTIIESTGYQEMLKEYVEEQAEESHLPGFVKRDLPKDRKETRYLQSMQPLFARHKVYLKPGQHSLIEQLVHYPNVKHDDCLDGLYLATKNNYPPDHTVRTQKRTEKEEIESLLAADLHDDWHTA